MTIKLSHYANRLARHLVKGSKRGLRDPWNWGELKAQFTEDEQEHLAEAAHELQQLGLISISEALDVEDNIHRIRPQYELYWALDSDVFDYSLDDDVAHLIRTILENETRGQAAKLVKCQSWTLRRFNPAFAKIVRLFPGRRVSRAQADEPYPAAAVLVTAEERVKLKAMLEAHDAAKPHSIAAKEEPAVSSTKRIESAKVKVGVPGFLEVEHPASRRVAAVLIGILIIVAGFLAWPMIADRAGVGFARAMPVLLEPADGTTLTDYPRTITFAWEPMPSAARYMLEVQAQDPNTGEWFPHPGQSRWSSEGPSSTIEFVGDQPGRWNVMAIAADGTRSRSSPWREFFYDAAANPTHDDNASLASWRQDAGTDSRARLRIDPVSERNRDIEVYVRYTAAHEAPGDPWHRLIIKLNGDPHRDSDKVATKPGADNVLDYRFEVPLAANATLDIDARVENFRTKNVNLLIEAVELN